MLLRRPPLPAADVGQSHSRFEDGEFLRVLYPTAKQSPMRSTCLWWRSTQPQSLEEQFRTRVVEQPGSKPIGIAEFGIKLRHKHTCRAQCSSFVSVSSLLWIEQTVLAWLYWSMHVDL